MAINKELKRVKVISRLGEIDGFSNNLIVFFDLYDKQALRDVRHYILLDKSVKLMFEPFGWKDKWYIDLVSIEHINENVIVLKDLYLDVIIYNDCKEHKIIDFDDLANALVEGKVSPKELENPLKGFQIFLDTCVYQKEFPPFEIKDYLK